MWDTTHTQVIVFNGEIYNYHELRNELEARGYRYNTLSDTEVILSTIDAWGIEEGLRKLRGMFALALYNTQSKQLLLARDRVGIKPLYWANVPGGLIFGSEIKALLCTGLLSRYWNPKAIHDYFAYGYAITPETCWQDIFMLPPGSWIELSPNGRRQGQYWHWNSEVDESLSQKTAVELIEQALVDSLKGHLIADVPLGAFLSGGLDSSLIVALLKEQLDTSVKVFNVGFSDFEYDESVLARAVAKYHDLEFHSIFLESGTADSTLFSTILRQYDEPFGDSSCIPTYLISREIRQHATVALSGDGGDEVLGGYPRYLLANQLASMASLRMLAPLMLPVGHMLPGLLGNRGRQVAKAWHFSQMPRIAMLSALHEYFSEDERRELYSREFAAQVQEFGPTVERFASFVPPNAEQPDAQLLGAEMGLRLHANYLRKVDVASSAHGLEVRVPYLDNEMLRLAAKIPFQRKVGKDGTLKVISRSLAAKYLPPEISTKRKQGFGIPFDKWISPDTRNFLEDLLVSSESRLNQVLNPRVVHGIWQDFCAPSQRPYLSRYQRYQRVFLLASFELWLRTQQPVLK